MIGGPLWEAWEATDGCCRSEVSQRQNSKGHRLDLSSNLTLSVLLPRVSNLLESLSTTSIPKGSVELSAACRSRIARSTLSET